MESLYAFLHKKEPKIRTWTHILDAEIMNSNNINEKETKKTKKTRCKLFSIILILTMR